MRGLKARNIAVSQSTLSRDIQELRLAKAGGIYTVVDPEAAAPHSEGSLARIIRDPQVGVEFLERAQISVGITGVVRKPGQVMLKKKLRPGRHLLKALYLGDAVYLVLALRLDVEAVLAARQPAQHEAGAVESV